MYKELSAISGESEGCTKMWRIRLHVWKLTLSGWEVSLSWVRVPLCTGNVVTSGHPLLYLVSSSSQPGAGQGQHGSRAKLKFTPPDCRARRRFRPHNRFDLCGSCSLEREAISISCWVKGGQRSCSHLPCPFRPVDSCRRYPEAGAPAAQDAVEE